MFSRLACCVAFNSFTILITFSSSIVNGCGVDVSDVSVGSAVVVGAAVFITTVDVLVLTGTDGEDVAFPIKKNKNPAYYELVGSINNQTYILKFTYSFYFSKTENTEIYTK